jgi:hypothetical protein
MSAKQKETTNERDNIPTMPFLSPAPQFMGQQAGPQSQSFNSGIQLDRNTPEILDAFRKNPYTHSLTNIA